MSKRHQVDPSDLSITEAIALRDEACEQADLASIAAGLSKCSRLRKIARQHMANAIALADRIDGKPDDSLSDAELLAALSA